MFKELLKKIAKAGSNALRTIDYRINPQKYFKEADRYYQNTQGAIEADRYYNNTQKQITSLKKKAPAKKMTLIKPVVASEVSPPVKPMGDFLETVILPQTRKQGIPDAVAASQWAVESGRATSSAINNFYGIGPHIPYPSVEANVNDYALTLKNILKKKGKRLEDIKNPYEVMKALQTGLPRYEGHNPDPTTYIRTVTNTPEWRRYAR